jgi:hypothetical protein
MSDYEAKLTRRQLIGGLAAFASGTINRRKSQLQI